MVFSLTYWECYKGLEFHRYFLINPTILKIKFGNLDQSKFFMANLFKETSKYQADFQYIGEALDFSSECIHFNTNRTIFQSETLSVRPNEISSEIPQKEYKFQFLINLLQNKIYQVVNTTFAQMLHISRLTKQLVSFSPSNHLLLSLPRTLYNSNFLNFSTTSADCGELSVSTNTISTLPSVSPEVEMWTPPIQKSEPEQIEVLLSREKDPKPEEPEAPNSDECCMSGCRVCVYDLYEQRCERYQKELDKWNLRERLRQGRSESLESAQ